MNKESRLTVLKKLAKEKHMVRKAKKPTKSVDFIAYTTPTESDIQDELVRLDGYAPRRK
jgi:hypothetical protein